METNGFLYIAMDAIISQNENELFLINKGNQYGTLFNVLIINNI